ncbi:MAG: hypothetical protein J6I46_00055 [Ruminococcus sp.]|nr:hypothetical protein [Ruminococcus sp.]
MANFGSYKENGVRSLDSAIDHAIAKRMNEANRVYENNVNEMFSKLHSQSDYNSSDYERIAFSNKEDASRFLQDMKDQGIDAVGSSRKVMGQILIEIPREINYSDLNADSELAKKMAGASMSSVSAADVIRDAGSRMDIGTEKPFKTEYLDEHGNESGDGDLYNYLTDEMDALGKVINNMVKIGTELEKYRPASGMAKSAVVINNETVVIDGKLVTDDATRESILKRHEERINTAEDILNKSSFDHETKIQPIVSNSEAIIKNIYKQDYAVTDNFKAESFYKDMAISKTQGDMMYSLYNTDPAKFTYKETQAINSFYNSGHVNNLDFSEREVLFKKLDKIKQDNDVQGFNKADWNEIKSQISLSDVEKTQRNEINSSGTTTCVRVDFALHELNDIASELNTDWHISNSPFTYKTSMLDVTKFGENGDALKNILKKSGELGLSREQIGVLDKLSNAKAAGLGEIKLNAMEKYHLSTAAEAYSLKFGKNLSAAEKTSLDSLLKSKMCTLNPSEYSALQNMISIQKDLGVNVTRANFNADKLLEINKAFIMRAQKEGIDIFSKKNGKWTIDPDKIGKLSSAQLKRFGISKHTQQFLMKLNRTQILREDLKDLKRIGLNLLLKADDSGTFAELYNAYTKVKKAYEYTTQSIIYLRQGVTYVKLRKGAKLKSSSKYGKGVLKPKTAKAKTPKKPKAKKPPKQVSSQKLAKHAAKAQKAQAKEKKKDENGEEKTVWHYDGEQITSFGANNNAFDKIDNKVIAPDGSVRSNPYGYSSIESGHTSNIKDIICMVDVMYGMDLDESIADLDKGEQSILGKTPAQLKWENLADNTVGFFKWLWNTVKAPFTSAKYEPMRKFCQKHVGYSTVCKYASTLFSDSHQEEIAFEVKYYKNEPIMINTDTGIIDITSNIDQENASILGYCKNPVKNKFEIFWNKNADTPRISPFFWKNGDDATGIKFPVDTGKYEVTVTMDNLADKNEEVCLRENMGSDEDTFKFIESQTKNYHCWKQFKTDEVSDSKVVYANSTGGDGWYSGNVNDWDFNTDTLEYHEGSDGWYDSEEAAKANVEAALRAEYDNASLPETKYFLDSNRDLFRKTSYEKPEFKVDYSDATIETWEEPDRPLEGGVEEEHVHFDRFSNVLSTEGGTGWGYVLKIDGKGTDGTEYHAEKNIDTDSMI